MSLTLLVSCGHFAKGPCQKVKKENDKNAWLEKKSAYRGIASIHGK
jgi:hypothetical protein